MNLIRIVVLSALVILGSIVVRGITDALTHVVVLAEGSLDGAPRPAR